MNRQKEKLIKSVVRFFDCLFIKMATIYLKYYKIKSALNKLSPSL